MRYASLAFRTLSLLHWTARSKSRVLRAAQFLTFAPHGEQTLVEKDSPSSRTTKSQSFSLSRSANFLSVRQHIFRAYPFTLKIAKLCFETTAVHSTIIPDLQLSEAPGSFGFLPHARGAGTGLVGVLTLTLVFDPPLYRLRFTIYTTFHR